MDAQHLEEAVSPDHRAHESEVMIVKDSSGQSSHKKHHPCPPRLDKTKACVLASLTVSKLFYGSTSYEFSIEDHSKAMIEKSPCRIWFQKAQDPRMLRLCDGRFSSWAHPHKMPLSKQSPATISQRRERHDDCRDLDTHERPETQRTALRISTGILMIGTLSEVIEFSATRK
jgi:hypothetical protein